MSNGKAPKNSIEKGENSKNSADDSLNDIENEAEEAHASTKFQVKVQKKEVKNDKNKPETCGSKIESTFSTQDTNEAKAKVDVVQKENCSKLLSHQKPILSQKETCTKLLPYETKKSRGAFLDCTSTSNETDNKVYPSLKEKVSTATQNIGTIKKTAKPLQIFQVDKKDVFKATHPQVQNVLCDKTKTTVKIHDQIKLLQKNAEETKCVSQQGISEQGRSTDVQSYLLSKMDKLSGAPPDVKMLPKGSIPNHDVKNKIKLIQTEVENKTMLKTTDRNIFHREESPQKEQPRLRDIKEMGAKQIDSNINRINQPCIKDNTNKPVIKEQGLNKRECQLEKIDIPTIKDEKCMKGPKSKDIGTEDQNKKKESTSKILLPDTEHQKHHPTCNIEKASGTINAIREEQLKILGIEFTDLEENKFENLLSKFESIEEIIEAMKSFEKAKVGTLTTTKSCSDKYQLKISDLSSDQFKSLIVAFADFNKKSLAAMATEFDSAYASTSAVKEEQHDNKSKIETDKDRDQIEEIYRQASYTIRTIPKDLPECYKLFDLSEFRKPKEQRLEVTFLRTISKYEDFALFDGSKDHEVLIETDFIKAGSIAECVKEPIKLEKSVYAVAKLRSFKKGFGVAFEPKEGMLLERDNIIPPPPFRDPPRYYIAKDATLAEYDYAYEKLEREKIIKKREIQMARLSKRREEPQFCQQFTQKEKLIGSVNLTEHVKEDKRKVEIHKTTVSQQPAEKAEIIEELPSRLKDAVGVQSKYKYDKSIHKEKTEQIHKKFDANEFEIATKRKLTADKYEILPSKIGNDIMLKESSYKYKKPIAAVEPIYERGTKAKIIKAKPEPLQRQTDERTYEITTKRKTKLSGEQAKVFPKHNVTFSNSLYKYEKQIVGEIIYQKIIETNIPEVKPEQLEKQIEKEEFEILMKNKESSEKATIISSKLLKDNKFVKSHYKYEKQITVEQVYEKVSKTKIIKDTNECLQKPTHEREYEIFTKTKLSYEKAQVFSPQDATFSDSLYKYEKLIVAEPVYHNVAKTKVFDDKPEQLQKKFENKECEIMRKNKEASEKATIILSNLLKDNKLVDSHYKYEKSIVVKPNYQKVIRNVLEDKPKQLQIQFANKKFEILTTNKEISEKFGILPSKYLKDSNFVDSYYKYKKPIAVESTSKKVPKSKFLKDIPEPLQKQRDEKKYEIFTKRELGGEKPIFLSLQGALFSDSFYEYKKPIVVKPTYEMVTRKDLEEKPEQLQTNIINKKFEIFSANKEISEKFGILPSTYLKYRNFADSHYKHEKPIFVKPTYQKIIRNVLEDKPEELQIKFINKKIEIFTTNKEISEKLGILPSKYLKDSNFVDSYYKYEKPIVVKPTYQKIIKNVLGDKPEELPKRIINKNFEIFSTNKEISEKFGILPTKYLKDSNFVDSHYKYKKPIVVKPTYQKITKNVLEDKPEELQKKIINKNFGIFSTNKEISEKFGILPSKYLKDSDFVDSYYKYEKPIFVKPTYQKIIRNVLEDKPEELPKKIINKNFGIFSTNKEISEKFGILPTKYLKDSDFVDSYYKYEKPIVVKPTYRKIIRNVLEDKPEELPKRFINKNFGIFSTNKEISEKFRILPTKYLKDSNFVDSHYKYKKPIVVKPTYQKIIRNVLEDKPEELPKRIINKNFEIFSTNKEISEKFGILPSKYLKDSDFVDSYYKYEKPIVVKPTYQKIIRNVLEDKPEELPKRIINTNFRIFSTNKEISEKFGILPTKYLKDSNFVDSHYKYKKPIVVKPTYQKIIRNVLEDKPEELPKRIINKNFEIFSTNKEISEKFGILPSKYLKDSDFVDSYYKYEKPIVVKPTYRKIIRNVLEDKPEELPKRFINKNFGIFSTNKEISEKFGILPTKYLKDSNFVDSHYKYKKPIVVKPTYQKIIRNVLEHKPEELPKRIINKKFEMFSTNKEISEKFGILPSKYLKDSNFVDSYYKYEKPIVVKPTYQKIIKNVLGDKPEELPKRIINKKFEIFSTNKEISEKFGILPSKYLKDSNFVDSYYKYEKPIVVKPTYQKIIKNVLGDKPEELPKRIINKNFEIFSTNKEISEKFGILPSKYLKDSNFVDSYYKYEKPIFVKPTFQKIIRNVLEDKPEELQKKIINKNFGIFSTNKEISEKFGILPSKYLKDSNFVDSYYKYEKPIFVKPTYQKIIRNVLEDKPEELQKKIINKNFGIFGTNKEISEKFGILPSKYLKDSNFVDSYYKYEKPIFVKPTFQKIIRNVLEDKPEELQKKIINKNFGIFSTNKEISEKFGILPSKYLKDSNFVDSYYKYEKPIVVKPTFQKIIRNILEDKPEELQKKIINKNFGIFSTNKEISEKFGILPSTYLKDSNFVDSYYKYEKPIVVKPAYQKAIRKVLKDKPERLQKKFVKKKFEISATNKEISEEFSILPSNYLKDRNFVDSYYKYEKPIVVKPAYQKATRKVLKDKPERLQKKFVKKKFEIFATNKEISEEFSILPSNYLKDRNFVDSYYKYEKPIVVKSAYQKVTRKVLKDKAERLQKKYVNKKFEIFATNKEISEEFDILPSNYLKDRNFVDSYYKYEKPIVVKSAYQKATKSKVLAGKPEQTQLKSYGEKFLISLKSEETCEKVEDLPSHFLRNISIVDSFYNYEKPLIIKPNCEIVKVHKEITEKVLSLKKLNVAKVNSDYIFLKPIAIEREIPNLEKLRRTIQKKKNQEIRVYDSLNKTTISSERPQFSTILREVPTIYIHSDYTFKLAKEKEDKKEEVKVSKKPIIVGKSCVLKIQEVPDYITKTNKPEIHFVDSVYRYEKPKDVKAVIEPVFEKATITKTEETPDQGTKMKVVCNYVDSKYKHERRKMKHPNGPPVQGFITVKKSQVTHEPGIITQLKEVVHTVDSTYIYEPPEKGPSILEPIKIQTATIIRHALDKPEYNILINEHDAIWINYVYKYEKIRPDMLWKFDEPRVETVARRKLPAEKPERSVTKSYPPPNMRENFKAVPIPEFNIIPHTYKEGFQSEPGTSRKEPQDDSRKKQKATITCPNCNNVTELRAVATNTTNTHLMAIGLAPLLLCFVPYILNRTRKIMYICTFCNVAIPKSSTKKEQ